MRFILFLLPFTLLTNGCTLDFKEDTTRFDILIIAGQSNTHQGLGLNEVLDKEHPNIFQLGRYSLYNHTILTAREPLQHHTSDTQRIGFGLTFAKLYQQHANVSNNPTLIIPCGFGGSSIAEWKPNQFLYKDLKERVNFVLHKFPKSRVKVFLWHQGEADIGNSNYASMLDAFILQTREDFGENLPFILGGMVPYWVQQSSKKIHQQNILKTTPSRMPNTGYADPEIPFVITKDNNKKDAVHYNAKGQRELGKRYFKVYQNLMN